MKLNHCKLNVGSSAPRNPQLTTHNSIKGTTGNRKKVRNFVFNYAIK